MTYGSDPQAKDLCRVLRIPGFLHQKKPDEPHMVRFAGGTGSPYSRTELVRAFPPMPERRESASSTGCDAGYIHSNLERAALALDYVPADSRDDWMKAGWRSSPRLETGGAVHGMRGAERA